MYLSVISAKALDDYKLLIGFENNEQKIFDAKPYLEIGKFKELKDKNYSVPSRSNLTLSKNCCTKRAFLKMQRLIKMKFTQISASWISKQAPSFEFEAMSEPPICFSIISFDI